MHPQDSSCLVFKAKRAATLLPCSFFMEGTLPVALTMFTKPPAVLTNQHRISISTKQYILNQIHFDIQEVCIQRKSTRRLFKNFKSQSSVTKHIMPLIKLTFYTYEWYCLKTLQSLLLNVQSLLGHFCCVCVYIHIQIHTHYISQTHYD